MENTEIQAFEINFAIDLDLKPEVFAVSQLLTDALNKDLTLTDYCTDLTKITVVMQCFAPENEFVKVKQRQSFKRKTKSLELYLILDHAQSKNAVDKEMLQLIAETYLIGIKKVLKRKTFDKKKFLEDIAKVIFRTCKLNSY